MKPTERCTPGEPIASGFLGYTMMFLAPSLVLFLLGLPAVASVWLALWLVYRLQALPLCRNWFAMNRNVSSGGKINSFQ